MKNYYAILGVTSNSSDEEIRDAYRKLAKKWHPDVNGSPEAESKFKEINEAYQALSKKDRQFARVFSPGLDPLSTIFSIHFDDLFSSGGFPDIEGTTRLTLDLDGTIGEDVIMEIRRMLAARGCKVKGHRLEMRNTR